MSDRDTVTQWLRALSPDGGGFALDDLGVCVLAAPDGGVVRIEVPETTGRVYLISYLGRASTSQGRELLARLLEANFLTRDTNGTTIAIDRQADQFALCYSDAVSALTPRKFGAVVESFFDTASQWRTTVATLTREAASDVDTPSPSESGDDVMIRI